MNDATPKFGWNEAEPKQLSMRQEKIAPAVWYIFEGDTKLCITNEANALYFVTLQERFFAQNAELAAKDARIAELTAALKPFAELWQEYKDDEWPPQKVLVSVDLLKHAALLGDAK